MVAFSPIHPLTSGRARTAVTIGTNVRRRSIGPTSVWSNGAGQASWSGNASLAVRTFCTSATA